MKFVDEDRLDGKVKGILIFKREVLNSRFKASHFYSLINICCDDSIFNGARTCSYFHL